MTWAKERRAHDCGSQNVPNMLKHITDLIAAKGVNIDTMLNKSRGDYAYTMLDLQGKIDPAIAKEIEDIDGGYKGYTSVKRRIYSVNY